MRVSDFDFELPAECIALRPAVPRDSSRLLVVEGGETSDRRFSDLPGYLNAGDVLVFNDTRVIPARLTGHRGAARIEVTLHKQADDGLWRAFARPAKRLHTGDTIDFGNLAAEVIDKAEGGEVGLRFDCAGQRFAAALKRAGAMPLPPYIARRRAPDTRDSDDYQTLFAARDGAVAAPTAGLHFTPTVIDRLAARGVTGVPLTLHVGAGTFLPVKAARTDDHVMHAEWGELGRRAADSLNRARDAGGRIVAVGTTSLRLLESAAREDGGIAPFRGETDIFITPGDRFRAVDLLITNFHLPKSTLFMLVCAFAGMATMKEAYAHAVRAGYRFYSYGDACLLYPAS